MYIKVFQKRFVILCSFLVGLTYTLNGCANTDIVVPPSIDNPLMTHRWLSIAGVILFSFIQAGIIATLSPQAANNWVEQTMPGLIFGIPLLWTKIGEWTYIFFNWLFTLWNPFISLFGFLNGFSGNLPGILTGIVLFGFIFPSPTIFYPWVLSMGVGMAIHLLWLGCLLFVNTSGSSKG